MTEQDSQAGTKSSTKGKKIFSLLLVVIIIASAFILFRWMVATKPKAKQRPKVKIGTFVEAEKVQLSDEQLILEAMGSVKPAKSISLTSHVSGEIISVSPRLQPGSYFETGKKLFSIDPSDYKLAIQQREADVAAARNELALEYGNQLVAKREFELLGETVSEEELNLMLRKPQLSKLQANLKAALAKLEQAKLDLSRTHILAPFNGVIDELNTNIGARVGVGSQLVNFTGVDEFWIEVSVPVNRLHWINIPNNSSTKAGSTVHIYNETVWGKDVYRKGEVIRLLPGLEKDGRMARLIVRILDPLALVDTSKPKLLLDSYVRVEIDCDIIKDVIAVDRKYIRSGNQIWIMDKDSNLDIRTLNILFKNKEKLIVKDGLVVGEHYITSPIASPVSGMGVMTKNDAQPKGNKKPEKRPEKAKHMKQGKDNG